MLRWFSCQIGEMPARRAVLSCGQVPELLQFAHQGGTRCTRAAPVQQDWRMIFIPEVTDVYVPTILLASDTRLWKIFIRLAASQTIAHEQFETGCDAKFSPKPHDQLYTVARCSQHLKVQAGMACSKA